MEVETYKDASEVLSVFDPYKQDWDEWIFRGQPDSQLPLLPSIWRKKSFEKFNRFYKSIGEKTILNILRKTHTDVKNNSYALDNEKIENITKWRCYVEFENLALFNFYYIANESGLKIDDANLQKLRHYDVHRRLKDIPNKADINIREFIKYLKGAKNIIHDKLLFFDAALPQHHGLSTRILDWTSDPRKAIFFAAYYYLKDPIIQNDNAENFIAVYAFKQKEDANKSTDPILIDRTFLRSENKFLHHQSGVFTVIYGGFYFLEHGHWPSVEDLLAKTAGKYFDVRKFKIHVDCVKEILERLDRGCGISISTLMPDYNYVAEKANHTLDLLYE